MKWKTCSHPQRQAIDLDLLDGNATFWDLSPKYALSISSLFRHKKHLVLQMNLTREKLQHCLRQDTLLQYNEFLQEARHHVRTASADGNTRQALQAIRAGTRILNCITKLDVHFDDDTIYRLLASPQWQSQDSPLPTDPQFRAEGHQVLSRHLFFPCPKIPPDPQADAWDQEDAAAADQARISPLETQNSELETLAFLREILPSLDQSQPEPRKMAAIKPKNQREKSAKLTPKNSHVTSNNLENQQDRQYKKIPEKTPV